MPCYTIGVVVYMEELRKRHVLVRAQEDLNVLVRRAKEEACHWFECNTHQREESKTLSSSPSRLDQRWSPPRQEVIKCNILAFWRNKNLMSGGAWIARNHEGNMILNA